MMQASTMWVSQLVSQQQQRRTKRPPLARSNSTPTDISSTSEMRPLPFQEPLTIDLWECSDRSCRISSKSGSSHSGSRRNSSPSVSLSASATARLQERSSSSSRISKSSQDLAVSINSKSHGRLSPGLPGPPSANTSQSKGKVNDAKEAKKVPSNVMLLTPWVTQVNCNQLIEQVKSGDILEFNIKFHHHWGIALIPKDKKASIENMELIHLAKDKNGRNRVVRQPMKEYWHSGVTARINNRRDVNIQPLIAGEVTSQANKLIVQSHRVWENSDKLVTFCRYGEGQKENQLSDAERWGPLSRCMELWTTMTSKPKSTKTTPAPSPKIRRKRRVSVNF